MLRCKFVRCVFLMACAAGTGCRSLSEYDLAARQMRQQEDAIYELRDQISTLQAQLDSCRRENSLLREHLSDGADADGQDDSMGLNDEPSYDDEGSFTPGMGEEFLEVPAVELGDPSSARKRPAGGSRRGLAVANHDDDIVVKSISLNPLLTGGYDFDDAPGDEGLQVVFEQRDSHGRQLHAAGDVTIRLVEPGAASHAPPVASWRFSGEEVADYYTKDAFGRATRFRLPWPNEPPESSELELVVEYRQTRDNPLRASRRVRLELPAESNVQLSRRENEARTSSELDGASAATADESTARRRSQWQPYR